MYCLQIVRILKFITHYKLDRTILIISSCSFLTAESFTSFVHDGVNNGLLTYFDMYKIVVRLFEEQMFSLLLSFIFYQLISCILKVALKYKLSLNNINI